LSKASIERKLTNVSSELSSIIEELQILTEQLAYVEDIASESRMRALVSETPIAANEYKESMKSVEALKRDFNSKTKKKSKLENKQDKLLDDLSRLLNKN